MGLAHDSNDCNSRRRPNRLRDELRQNILLVMLGNRGDDGGQGRNVHELVLLGELVAQRVEVDVAGRATGLGCFMVFDEGVGDVGATSQEALALWCQVGLLLGVDRDGGHGGGRHGEGLGSEIVLFVGL